MKLKSKKIIYVLVIFLLIISFFIYTASMEHNKYLEEEKRVLSSSLNLIKSNFETLITGKILSLNGLIAYVEL